MEYSNLFIIAILMTLVYFGVMVYAIIAVDADYFVNNSQKVTKRKNRTFGWWAVKIIKNGIGLILVLIGFAMLVLPGQGLLTILMGLLFVDIPGKRKFAKRLVRHPAVYRTINLVRAKAGKPPIRRG